MAVQSGIYKGVTAADRAAERRSRLMDATLEVWADQSRRTTMTAICNEAGLTERYFYESFRGLDEALAAVLEAIATEIETTTVLAGDEAGDDPLERTRATMRSFVDLVTADPRKARVAIVEAAAMPALRARRTQLVRHLAHRATERAEEWMNLPPDSHDARELAGLMFVGGLAELVTAWLEGAVRADPDDLVEAAVRSFLSAYAA
jgi:AcrR family transcriptional regulator